MALHYNLAKVYAISENDTDFVMDIVTLFVSEVPQDLLQMKEAINEKQYKAAYGFAHKMKPTLDLLGMTVAHEEIIYIENWTRNEGKRKEVKDTYKSIESRIEKAVKEIRKDFNM
ncbi:HPt (histidine-containing phosphotransfer) domain-containing protein [Flavobacterium arsenatis]|uniref:HPt (Histidine-containing phosphotransfer) domain-containing protein n=1 Tax=Flavobacterium arsenatis TaxID=1484332 RepID=A0ABU1TJK0_9FLAO|nr:Hpt domain-containing protein [Flavobacterium arsenatis]MDR6966169.1 HPt (histidine-containing phosphotransfer) domain-containing protein [Flavobacterium arsenatis]